MNHSKPLTAMHCAAVALMLFSAPPIEADETTNALEDRDGWTGNVSGLLGRKSLDDEDWGELDSQRSVGIMSDFRKTSWPVSIAADLMFAADDHLIDGTEVTGGTAEFHLGARKVFEIEGSAFRPYLGGGLTIVDASLENELSGVTIEDSDTALGGWVGVGTYFNVTDQFIVGLDVRYSKTEVKLFDQDREAGGLNVAISAGYHW